MLCIAYESTTNVVRSAVCRVITVKIFSLFATPHVHDRPQTIDQSVQETVHTCVHLVRCAVYANFTPILFSHVFGRSTTSKSLQ